MALPISPLILGLLVCFGCLHPGWCQSNPSCSNTAPTTCSFADTFCGWEPNGWQKSVDHTTAITTDSSDHKSILRSDLACSPQNSPRCLNFEFFLFDSNADTILDVVLEDNRGKKIILRVTSSDSPGNWTTGAITIITTSDFRVTFIATWKTGQSPVISVKNVEVKNTHCEKSPNWASDHGPSIETTGPSIETTGPSIETTTSPPSTTKSNSDVSSAEGYQHQCSTITILLFGIALSVYSFFGLWD